MGRFLPVSLIGAHPGHGDIEGQIDVERVVGIGIAMIDTFHAGQNACHCPRDCQQSVVLDCTGDGQGKCAFFFGIRRIFPDIGAGGRRAPDGGLELDESVSVSGQINGFNLEVQPAEILLRQCISAGNERDEDPGDIKAPVIIGLLRPDGQFDLLPPDRAGNRSSGFRRDSGGGQGRAAKAAAMVLNMMFPLLMS